MRTTVYRKDDHIGILYQPYVPMTSQEAQMVSYPDIPEDLIERIKTEKPAQVQALLDRELSRFI